MAESTWSALYDEAKTGTVAGIAEGTYEVEVADVRALAKSRLLFLDLRVMSGPLAGRMAQVNLYLPEPGNRGAGFHFRNKIMGFGDLSETFRQMDSAAGVEDALSILADALTGRKVSVDIELRSDGEYAGTNQLAKTKPADDTQAVTLTQADVTTVPAEAVAATQPAVQPAPAQTVAQPVAAPQEATQPAADAARAAMAGEVPF